MTDSVRMIQWNVCLRSESERISDFLSTQVGERPAVVCLQEVRPGAFEALQERLRPDGAAYSLDLRAPGRFEGRERRLGVAVLAFGFEVTASRLLDRSVFPERTLRVDLRSDERSIEVLTFHSLTGVGYRKAKASNFAALADHLAEDHSLDVMCFDANEPRTDSWDADAVEFWTTNGDRGRAADLLMGPGKVHPLEDVARLALSGRMPPEGRELPITHWTRGIGRRYDHIFASPAWRVMRVQHPLDASLEATSDHSAVIADLEWVGADLPEPPAPSDAGDLRRPTSGR